MLNPQQKIYTPEEYFAFESASEEKSEYYHGELFAMAGSSPNHNQIVVNMITALNVALRDSPCRVFTSDMRVQIANRAHYVYPDVTVVCGALAFAERRNDMITNPILIIEVLSESTKDDDRGSKFAASRKIPTLREYLLIDQAGVHVEYFHKEPPERWILEEFDHEEDALTLLPVEVVIPLKTIYARVEWQKSIDNFLRVA